MNYDEYENLFERCAYIMVLLRFVHKLRRKEGEISAGETRLQLNSIEVWSPIAFMRPVNLAVSPASPKEHQ